MPLGAKAALLLSPKSGKQIRNQIKRKAGKLKKGMIGYVEDWYDTIRDGYNDKVDRITDASKKAIDTVGEKVKLAEERGNHKR